MSLSLTIIVIVDEIGAMLSNYHVVISFEVSVNSYHFIKTKKVKTYDNIANAPSSRTPFEPSLLGVDVHKGDDATRTPAND